MSGRCGADYRAVTDPPKMPIRCSAFGEATPQRVTCFVTGNDANESPGWSKTGIRSGHQTCLSINRLWNELCDILRRLLEPQLPDIMIVQFRNEKLVITGSIPITIDCNVVAFIVFEEGFHQPIKRTKQSAFSGCNGRFRHTLVD
ncbi:hypothetical protein TNCV_502141 [Trichonephila clavipes]|nr:hypothetical protein TNCV_502141 [Trichonephila clavipes]